MPDTEATPAWARGDGRDWQFCWGCGVAYLRGFSWPGGTAILCPECQASDRRMVEELQTALWWQVRRELLIQEVLAMRFEEGA